MTRDLLQSCDLVLYVQDITEAGSQKVKFNIDKPVVYVANKCDLVREPKNAGTQKLENILISAKDNEGFDLLVQEILERLSVADFDVTKPAAFTQRQRELLLAIVETDQLSKQLIFDLLHSRNN